MDTLAKKKLIFFTLNYLSLNIYFLHLSFSKKDFLALENIGQVELDLDSENLQVLLNFECFSTHF